MKVFIILILNKNMFFSFNFFCLLGFFIIITIEFFLRNVIKNFVINNFKTKKKVEVSLLFKVTRLIYVFVFYKSWLIVSTSKIHIRANVFFLILALYEKFSMLIYFLFLLWKIILYLSNICIIVFCKGFSIKIKVSWVL